MRSEMDMNALSWYARPAAMTEAGAWRERFDGLPSDVGALVQVVQGLMVHVFWAEHYGLHLTPERKAEVTIRDVASKLEEIARRDNRPLAVPRALEERLVGNCRDYSVLLCAMLRHQGIPARARCGFATYFRPGHYEDHWVCEVWREGEERWVTVDPQLDALQRRVLQVFFDPLDVPPAQFLPAGRAWLICRRRDADASDFGILDMAGYAFVRANVVRDFLALNKIELLPWDGWGPMADSEAEAVTRNVPLIDRLANLTVAGDELFLALRATYEYERREYGTPTQLLDLSAAG